MQKTKTSNYRLTYDEPIITEDNIKIFKTTLKKLTHIERQLKELIAEQENDGQFVITFSSKLGSQLIDFDLIKEYVTRLSKLNVGDQSISKITKQCIIPRTGEELSERELKYEDLYSYIQALYLIFDSTSHSGYVKDREDEALYRTSDIQTSHSGYLKDREEAIEQEINLS